MVLLRASFPVSGVCFVAVLINRVPVFVQDINIGMTDIKVIVRTIEIGDRQVAGTDRFRFFKDPFLKFLLVLSDDIKRMVDVIKGEPVKGFKEKVFIMERIPL